jgi:hypothetical protein
MDDHTKAALEHLATAVEHTAHAVGRLAEQATDGKQGEALTYEVREVEAALRQARQALGDPDTSPSGVPTGDAGEALVGEGDDQPPA